MKARRSARAHNVLIVSSGLYFSSPQKSRARETQNLHGSPIMQRAGSFDWTHRDPFDRIIVATALLRDLDVVSKDETLDSNGSPGWRRIW